MYYEIMGKMHLGVRVRKFLHVWLTNGIIDEDNYAFLTGKSTMQPLMITKLVLEHARLHNNTLTMIDIDFSKAYDSTEGFAKDMTLKRSYLPLDGTAYRILWLRLSNVRPVR